MFLSVITDTCDIYSHPDQVNTVELDLFSPRTIEVNYEFECTPLFRAIQRKDWEKAAEIATENPEQVRTWVLRYHDGGESNHRMLRWRMLPIHALFLFSGTHALAVLFLFIYPESVCLTDDQDMMPLHLACRNGAAIETFEELLAVYPQALMHNDYKGRTPLDLLMMSTHSHKQDLISLFLACGGVSSCNVQLAEEQKQQKSSSSPSVTQGNIDNVQLLKKHQTTSASPSGRQGNIDNIHLPKKHHAPSSSPPVTRGMVDNVQLLRKHHATSSSPKVAQGMVDNVQFLKKYNATSSPSGRQGISENEQLLSKHQASSSSPSVTRGMVDNVQLLKKHQITPSSPSVTHSISDNLQLLNKHQTSSSSPSVTRGMVDNVQLLKKHQITPSSPSVTLSINDNLQLPKKHQTSTSSPLVSQSIIDNIQLPKAGGGIQRSCNRVVSNNSNSKKLNANTSNENKRCKTLDVENDSNEPSNRAFFIDEPQITETGCDKKTDDECIIFDEKNMWSKPTTIAKSVNIEPVVASHGIFSDSLKKAPKSPRVLKIASEKKKGSTKGQQMTATKQQSQHAFQFPNLDLAQPSKQSLVSNKIEMEPDKQARILIEKPSFTDCVANLSKESTFAKDVSNAISAVLGESSPSSFSRFMAALSTTSVSMAVPTENQSPKSKGDEPAFSFSKKVLDKIKPRLQQISESTRSEAKTLIQTMRTKRLQSLSELHEEIEDEQTFENDSFAETEYKDSSEHNGAFIAASNMSVTNHGFLPVDEQSRQAKNPCRDELKLEKAHFVTSSSVMDTAKNTEEKMIINSISSSNIREGTSSKMEDHSAVLSSNGTIEYLLPETYQETYQDENHSAGFNSKAPHSTTTEDSSAAVLQFAGHLNPKSAEANNNFKSVAIDPDRSINIKIPDQMMVTSEVMDESTVLMNCHSQEKHHYIDPSACNDDGAVLSELITDAVQNAAEINYSSINAAISMISAGEETVRIKNTSDLSLDKEAILEYHENLRRLDLEESMSFSETDSQVENNCREDNKAIQNFVAINCVSKEESEQAVLEYHITLRCSDVEEAMSFSETDSQVANSCTDDNNSHQNFIAINCLSKEECNNETADNLCNGSKEKVKMDATLLKFKPSEEKNTFNDCASLINEETVSSKGIKEVGQDADPINPEAREDNSTCNDPAMHTGSSTRFSEDAVLMELTSEDTEKKEASLEHNENFERRDNIDDATRSFEIDVQIDSNNSSKDSSTKKKIESFIGETKEECNFCVNYGEVERTMELKILSQVFDLEEEAHLKGKSDAEDDMQGGKPVQFDDRVAETKHCICIETNNSDQTAPIPELELGDILKSGYCNNEDSVIRLNCVPLNRPSNNTQQQHSKDIICVSELLPVDKKKNKELFSNVEVVEDIMDEHRDDCITHSESSSDDYAIANDTLIKSGCTLLSGNIEIKNINPAEHAVKGTLCENDANILKAVRPMCGEVERTSKTFSAIIEQDDESLYFIDLSFNIINLIDDDDHEAIQLVSDSEKSVDASASKVLDERRQKMRPSITIENTEEQRIAKNMGGSFACKKLEKGISEKKNAIPSYVRLHYDAMELVLKSEQRDDNSSSSDNADSQRKRKISPIHVRECQVDQAAKNNTIVCKFDAAKPENKNVSPSFVRLRSPSSATSCSHKKNVSADENLRSPVKSNVLSLSQLNSRFEEKNFTKQSTEQFQQDQPTVQSSVGPGISRHHGQSSNIGSRSPGSAIGCNKLNFPPLANFRAEQKQAEKNKGEVKRPSMRLRTSWLAPSN